MFCISQKKARRGNRARFTAAATLPSNQSFSESSQMPVLHSPYWGMGIYTTVLSRPSVTCLSGQAPGPQRPSSSASSPGFHMTSSVPSPSLRNRQEISLLVFSFPIPVCNPLDCPEKRFHHSGKWLHSLLFSVPFVSFVQDRIKYVDTPTHESDQLIKRLIGRRTLTLRTAHFGRRDLLQEEILDSVCGSGLCRT